MTSLPFLVLSTLCDEMILWLNTLTGLILYSKKVYSPPLSAQLDLGCRGYTMGRPRKGHFQRENVIKVASSKEVVESNTKEAANLKSTDESSMFKVATSTRKVSKLNSGTRAKSKIAEVSTVYSDSENDDQDLIEELNKLTITKKIAPTPPLSVPSNILDLVVYQEMLLRIPAFAHPAVTKFLISN